MARRRATATEAARALALRELDEIAHGRRRSVQDETVWRFTRCADWQCASLAVARGLAVEERNRHPVFLSPPPGWLPPLT